MYKYMPISTYLCINHILYGQIHRRTCFNICFGKTPHNNTKNLKNMETKAKNAYVEQGKSLHIQQIRVAMHVVDEYTYIDTHIYTYIHVCSSQLPGRWLVPPFISHTSFSCKLSFCKLLLLALQIYYHLMLTSSNLPHLSGTCKCYFRVYFRRHISDM